MNGGVYRETVLHCRNCTGLMLRKLRNVLRFLTGKSRCSTNSMNRLHAFIYFYPPFTKSKQLKVKFVKLKSLVNVAIQLQCRRKQDVSNYRGGKPVSRCRRTSLNSVHHHRSLHCTVMQAVTQTIIRHITVVIAVWSYNRPRPGHRMTTAIQLEARTSHRGRCLAGLKVDSQSYTINCWPDNCARWVRSFM